MRHGSRINPPNRFERVRADTDLEHFETDPDAAPDPATRPIEYIDDRSVSIVTENDSPDVAFRYSVNPYRGCAHGCSYCYARPGHEYLGFNAGLEFETKIVVKRDAAKQLRAALRRRSWTGDPICFSGVTDCYQPAERRFRLTRQCLEVALECRQPVSVITKNALILRDLDLFQEMAQHRLVHVYVSVTTLSAKLARAMEPRTSVPAARLRAICELSQAGVPVGVMVAPVVPGLNDSEIPAILHAAAEAGAGTAGYVLLRLPLTVEPVFMEWIDRTHPLAADKVRGLIRQMRQGKFNQTDWHTRMVGSGPIADQIASLFRVARRKCGLDQSLPPHDRNQFRPPPENPAQMTLF